MAPCSRAPLVVPVAELQTRLDTLPRVVDSAVAPCSHATPAKRAATGGRSEAVKRASLQKRLEPRPPAVDSAVSPGSHATPEVPVAELPCALARRATEAEQATAAPAVPTSPAPLKQPTQQHTRKRSTFHNERRAAGCPNPSEVLTFLNTLPDDDAMLRAAAECLSSIVRRVWAEWHRPGGRFAAVMRDMTPEQVRAPAPPSPRSNQPAHACPARVPGPALKPVWRSAARRRVAARQRVAAGAHRHLAGARGALLARRAVDTGPRRDCAATQRPGEDQLPGLHGTAPRARHGAALPRAARPRRELPPGPAHRTRPTQVHRASHRRAHCPPRAPHGP